MRCGVLFAERELCEAVLCAEEEDQGMETGYYPCTLRIDSMCVGVATEGAGGDDIPQRRDAYEACELCEFVMFEIGKTCNICGTAHTAKVIL